MLDALYLGRTVAGLLANHLTLDRRVAAFARRLDEALATPVPPLDGRRPDELVAHYRDLRARLLLRWDAPLVNDFFAMIFYGLLRHLVTRWCGDRDGTLQNDLIGGEGGIVSAEPALRMLRLSRLAAATPAMPALMSSATLQAIVTELSGELLTEYRAYLEKFGDRTVNELKLESATLHDAQYRAVLPYVRPELVLLAEREGELAGFIFAIPDLLQGKRGHRVDTAIVKTMAVDPSASGMGLGGVLMDLVQRAARNLGFRRAIHALMHDENVSRSISDRYGRTIRRYALYTRPLGAR